MLSVVMLSVVMLSVIMLSVVMLSAVMRSVILVSVVAPIQDLLAFKPVESFNIPFSFQRYELNHLRAEHRKQLEEISAQLLLFESSLRTKEKQLQDMLLIKDQVKLFKPIFWLLC
jgi:hypothetical protein